MKRKIALLLAAAMMVGLAGCSGKEKEEKDATQETEQVKLVTNGRLSALEAPEGWEQGEATTENHLLYVSTSVETSYGEPAELWIDIDDFDTPERNVERAKELNENMGGCEVEEKKIGDVDFYCVIPAFGSRTLYGTKDNVTILVSFDEEIDLEDETVQSIINSIEVAPEE